MEGQLAKLAVGFLAVFMVVALFFGIGLAMAIYRAKVRKDKPRAEDEQGQNTPGFSDPPATFLSGPQRRDNVDS